MRLVFGIGSGLLMIFALLIAGARQIGHRHERDHFPLPSADGCWQGLCFFEMSRDEIMEALKHHPDVAQCGGSPQSSPDTYIFRTNCDTTPPMTVIFYIGEGWYNFQQGYNMPGNPPLMQAGDVIATLGIPDQVYICGNGICLYYFAERLEIWVRGANWGDWKRMVMPHDEVYNISMLDPTYLKEIRDYLSDYDTDWHGFGPYDFER